MEKNNHSYIKTIFAETPDALNEIIAAQPNSIIKISHFQPTWNASVHEFLAYAPVVIPSLNGKEYEIYTGKIINKHTLSDGMTLCSTETLTFARIEIYETHTMNLEQAAYAGYQKIFDYMKSALHPHFLRAWNYIPNILSETNQLERYRQFNAGRWDAWKDFGPKFPDGSPKRPAMTGIGSFGGPLIIEALFSSDDVIEMENPRQTQFIHYSQKWGAKPPVSARGSLLKTAHGGEVYIAGTASLLGEDVAHEGDIVAQTEETLRNIEALIDTTNMARYGEQVGYSLKDIEDIRVYIKNKHDYPIVRDVLSRVWQDKDIIYLQDDICRPTFLIEIEGVARKSTSRT